MTTVGDSALFSLESCITAAYSALSLRALGYFVVSIKGSTFGVRAAEATMLANSYDEIAERLQDRGRHTAPFAKDEDGRKIEEAFWSARMDEESQPSLGGLSSSALELLTRQNKLWWIPDGDAAFDDGSQVLQFDVENQVRLIAFKSEWANGRAQIAPRTLVDCWIDGDVFYGVLAEWWQRFDSAWQLSEKL